MKILFIDWAPFNYDTRTPLTQPLGGAQSAAAYLSAALAARGHEVAFINQVPEERRVDGVLFTRLPKDIPWINGFDVIISVTGLHADTLQNSGCRRPVIAWCPHDIDQQAVASLRSAETHARYERFVLVSDWQRQQYLAEFGLPPEKTAVLRNAMSPAFTAQQRDWRWLEEKQAPQLVYSTTPFRGLDILLMAFPLIRKAIPEARLRIHCGMKTYARTEQDVYFRSLYEMARVLAGVENIGPVGQAELAQSLARGDLFTYPCTFRETSCISAMEAGASGLLTVTTDLGALPETTAGYATMIGSLGSGPGFGVYATRYADAVVAAYEHAMANPQTTRQRLEAQMQHHCTHNNWATRAAEWEALLMSIGATAA